LTPTATPTSSNPAFNSATFIYDGDGKRVKSIINLGVGTNTTYFVGGHYEVTNGTVTKYYYAGSQRIAMRANGTLNYILGDHLGSTSLVTDASGVVISETRYKAWGETRYSSGTSPTKYTYTGQYSYASDFGLHFYNARWYDSSLARFAQADSIIPSSIQGLDRYAYANNGPVKYTDPTGHVGCDEDANGKCINYEYKERKFYGLYAYAFHVSKNVGKKDALDAMAKIVDKAYSIYGEDEDGMMRALSNIFLGVPEYGPGTLIKADEAIESGEPPYFLVFGDKGFHPDFRDKQNQVRHVWGYIAETYGVSFGPQNATVSPGALSGFVGNYVHEYEERGQLGGSWDDFILAVAGIGIGQDINNGTVALSELGNHLRETLGKNAPNYVLTDYRAWQFNITIHLLPKVEPWQEQKKSQSPWLV
jgi:RHS repeat-associated protein